MPLTDLTYSRPWTFVEQYEAGDAALRAAFDAQLADLVEPLNIALGNGLRFVGDWSAASGAFPDERPDQSDIRARDAWVVSLGGAVDDVSFARDEVLVALVDDAGPTYSGNWLRIRFATLAAMQAIADQISEDADQVAEDAEQVSIDRGVVETARDIAVAAANKLVAWRVDFGLNPGETELTLTAAQASLGADRIRVFIGGVAQRYGHAWTLDANTITFAEALPNEPVWAEGVTSTGTSLAEVEELVGEATDLVDAAEARSLDSAGVAAARGRSGRPWLFATADEGRPEDLIGYTADDIALDALLGPSVEISGGGAHVIAQREWVPIASGRVYEARFDGICATDSSGISTVAYLVETWEEDGTTNVETIAARPAAAISVADGRVQIAATLSHDVEGADHVLDADGRLARAKIAIEDADTDGVWRFAEVWLEDVTDRWRAETAASSAEADAEQTAEDRAQTTLDRAAALASATQAGVYRDQAATLAAAAGAPSGETLPTLPDAGHPEGSYFWLRVGPGIQIWKNVSGAWADTEVWAKRPEYESFADLIADTTTYAAGTVVTVIGITASYTATDSTGSLGQVNAGGQEFDVITGDVRAFGAVGDGETDDTAAFHLVEAAGIGPVVNLGGKTYALTSEWADPADGITLTKDYVNGSLLMDGRPYVQDGARLAAEAGALVHPVPATPRPLGLYRAGMHEYLMYRPLGGRYWEERRLYRTGDGIPFNADQSYVRQYLGVIGVADSRWSWSGGWASETSATSNIYTADPASYLGGRAKQAIAAGDVGTLTYTGSGDVYVSIATRPEGGYLNVLRNGGTDYLVLPESGGNRVIDCYSAALTPRQVFKVAAGLPYGVHTITFTVSSTPGTGGGNRAMIEAAPFLDAEIGPWSPEADAPQWTEDQYVQRGEVRKNGGLYYYAGAVDAQVTASISGTTMTVTAVASGSVRIGAKVYGTGVSAATQIVSQISGTAGGTGDYEVSVSQTVSSTAISLRGATCGATAPTHSSGTVSDGVVDWVQRAASGYTLNSQPFQLSGSQLEYAGEVKPAGATAFEDFGGALHGNEDQISAVFRVDGDEAYLPVGGWSIGERVSLVELINITHSEIGGGSTPIGWSTLQYDMTRAGFRIDPDITWLMDVELGYFYRMHPLAHYGGVDNKFAFTEVYTPGDGWRSIADFYGQNNPFVGRTKDFVCQALGPAFAPNGLLGVPSSIDAPLKMRMTVRVDPQAVDGYRQPGLRLMMSKAMNTAGRYAPPSEYITHSAGQAVEIGDWCRAGSYYYQATTAGTTGATTPVHTSGTASDGGVTWAYRANGYESLPWKLYFELVSGENPQPFAAGSKIRGAMLATITLEDA